MREAGLVSEAVDGFDTRLRPAATLSRCYDGIADAAIRQPAGAAPIQTFTPRQVQLCRRGQLRSCLSAVRLCFVK